MEKEVIIIGAGSVGIHIAANAGLYGLKDRIRGFLDDDPSKIGMQFFGLDVIGNADWILNQKDFDVVIGIAFPEVKKQILSRLKQNATLHFPSLLAGKHVWVSEGCSIGQGSIIYPGCSINYGASIGDFVVMNMNCAVGHHANIGHFSSLAPGVSFGGHTSVGVGVDIGIGASTLQGVTIGDGAVIGGQTMLIRDVAPKAVVMGIPGKAKKESNG